MCSRDHHVLLFFVKMAAINSVALSPGPNPSSTTFNIIKKNIKSPVWAHFGLRADEANRVSEDDLERPVCRECQKVVLAKGGNTSNLFSHLRERHPTLFAALTPTTLKK